MERKISGNSLITNGSKIGEHTIEFHKEFMTMEDTGGFFVESSNKRLNYGKELQQIAVSRSTVDGCVKVRGLSSEKTQLFSFACSFDRMFRLLGDCEYFENFITIVNFKDLKGLALEHEKLLRREEIAHSYTLVKSGEKFIFAKVHFENGYVYFESDSEGTDKVHLSHIEEIQNEVHTGNNSVSSIKTSGCTYELFCTSKIRQILNQVMDDLTSAKNIGDKANQIVLKGVVSDFFAYKSGEYLKMYEAKTLNLKYEFKIENLKLYLGSRYIILQHENDIVCSFNENTKILCMNTGIKPTELHVLINARLIAYDEEIAFDELLLWQDDRSWYMFDSKNERMIKECNYKELHKSNDDATVIVLKDGLLSSEFTADFLGNGDTPKILKTTTGFPVFFERLKISTVRISIPGKILWERSVKNFYDAQTHQVDNDVVMNLDELKVKIPVDLYKGTYTQSLLDLKTPSLSDTPLTALMTSRARNLSDMLLYEFFSQWQILLDYMSSFVDDEEFTEEEITNYGLFMYHAIFQQRKRMEEVSSKFPHFMLTLATEVGTSNASNHIYQKQQRQLFQLSAQLKSQFIELENLLSQITYIHFHNEEYQKRINQAYKESSLKKAGGALVAGIGVTVFTGGLGLILPAMTLFSEWANAKQRKELNEIQIEKEFKKNEFLFKKAIDLIRHMDSFTINYHVDVLNQFTFENLRHEAREIASLKLNYQQKKTLLKQSIHLYTKNTLPVDFNQKLLPHQIITSILEKPLMKNEEIESLFLN